MLFIVGSGNLLLHISFPLQRGRNGVLCYFFGLCERQMEECSDWDVFFSLVSLAPMV
jgi:hypothetical protein